MASRLEELEKERSAAFEQHLEKRVQERLEQLHMQTGDLPAPMASASADGALTSSVQELEQRIRVQVEQAHASLADVESAAGRLREQAAAAISSAQSDWKARVEADLAAATDRWNQQIEGSVESAARQAGERLARDTQLAAEQMERDLAAAPRRGEQNARRRSQGIREPARRLAHFPDP